MKALAAVCSALLASACFAQAPDVAGLYDVTSEGSSQKVKVGEKGKLVIEFHTKAGSHISGSFAQDLDAASLKGKRIGALRQRFVGFTGEREIADGMARVIKELQSQGAVIVEVAIADYDEKYAAARGAAPGSLRAGWTAYLSRGSKPG